MKLHPVIFISIKISPVKISLSLKSVSQDTNIVPLFLPSTWFFCIFLFGFYSRRSQTRALSYKPCRRWTVKYCPSPRTAFSTWHWWTCPFSLVFFWPFRLFRWCCKVTMRKQKKMCNINGKDTCTLSSDNITSTQLVAGVVG